MKKTRYAKAIELRTADDELNEKFKLLPNAKQWEWCAYACNNEPKETIAFCRQLVFEQQCLGKEND